MGNIETRKLPLLWIIAAVAAVQQAARSRASDMEIGEPDARLALISEGRGLERRCAGLAVAEAKRTGGPTEEQAVALLETVAA